MDNNNINNKSKYNLSSILPDKMSDISSLDDIVIETKKKLSVSRLSNISEDSSDQIIEDGTHKKSPYVILPDSLPVVATTTNFNSESLDSPTISAAVLGENELKSSISDGNIHIAEKLKKLLRNYMNLNTHLDNISDDIKNISSLHVKMTSSVSNREKFYNYGTYIDDILFQKKILTLEYALIKDIHIMLKRKIYGDLFRLYLKILKLIALLQNEYTDIKEINISTKNILQNVLDNNIKIYDELDPLDRYEYKDIINIFKKITVKIDELQVYILKLEKFIKTTDVKNKDGYAINLMIIGLSGEKDKIVIDADAVRDILKETIIGHLRLSEKYLKRAEEISLEIKDNTDEFTVKLNNITKNNA